MELENRPDVPDEDLTCYEGVATTTVRHAAQRTCGIGCRPIDGRPSSFKRCDES
jgi:hypothetical protein